MRILALFIFLSVVPASFAIHLEICGFSQDWLKQNAKLERRLTARDLSHLTLTYKLSPTPWQKLAEAPVFTASDEAMKNGKFWELTINRTLAYIPLLSRFITPEDNRLASFKMDQHSIGLAQIVESTGCVKAEALDLRKVGAEIFASADVDLWERLSSSQRNTYIAALLVSKNLIRFKRKIEVEVFAEGFLDSKALENLYRQLLGSKDKALRGDLHALFTRRDLDSAEGRRDALENWVYSFTQWISESHFETLSDAKFKKQMNEHFLKRCSADWVEAFPYLSSIELGKVCLAAATIFSANTLKWLRQFQKSKTPLEEFLNPYTVNSYWRGYVISDLYKIVFENSRPFQFWERF